MMNPRWLLMAVLAVLGSGDDAMAFPATQGDVWDTQGNMFLALLGALSSQLLLRRRHDRQLAALSSCSPGRPHNELAPLLPPLMDGSGTVPEPGHNLQEPS